MRNVLVLAGRTPARWTEAAKREPGTGWHVLPLGLIPEAYAQSNAASLASVADVRYVQASWYSESAQERLRDAVPALVEQLARHPGPDGIGLRDSLEAEGVNLWWCLEITEKSAFRGRWVQDLYYLCLVEQACQKETYDAIWVDTDDPGLAMAFKSWKKAAGPVRLIDPVAETSSQSFYLSFFQRLARVATGAFLRRLVFRWCFPGVEAVGKTKNADYACFFSFYPSFWDKPFTPETADRFFGEIPERLGQRTPVSFLVWMDLTAAEIWRRRQTLATVFKARHIKPLQALLSVRHLFAALKPGHVKLLLRFYRRIRSLTSWDFRGFDVAVLLREELTRNLVSRELWFDLLIRQGVAALLEQERPRCLIYRSEFQPFETSLTAACRERIPTVGFQHAAIGRNHFGYRWTPSEWSARPGKPDFLICTGSYAAELLARQGIRPDHIQVCGPARYRSMFRYFGADRAELRQRCQIPGSSTVFFVAATVVWAEVRNILEMLETGLAGRRNEAFYFLFKCHPSADFSERIREHIARRMPWLAYRILPHGVPLYDFVAASDALLSAGTTLSLEALCLGVMPIVFEDASRFSVNPMLEAREGLFTVTSAEELKQAIAAVAGRGADLEARRQQWPDIIRRYFLTLEGDPVDRFVNALSQWGLISSPSELIDANAFKPSPRQVVGRGPGAFPRQDAQMAGSRPTDCRDDVKGKFPSGNHL